jgi:hypothetical protein
MYSHRNKLLRYREIIRVYNEHKEEDIPNTKIFHKYIYPRFNISMRTFYNVLETPVERELKKLGE